jgi:hypothetical protein
MKTIIHTWSNNFNINQEHVCKYNYLKETNFYFGLGDLIRSTIKLFHLSKIMHFRLIVDIQHHPISNFLKSYEHEFSEYVRDNKNNIQYVCYGGVEDYINETKSEKDILLILTNDFYEGDVSIECKNFIKKILRPNDNFQNFINNKISKIPFNIFNVYHYRINDNDFLNKTEEIIYENFLVHFKNNKEYNDVLITDTINLKKYIYLNEDVFVFDTKICHLGLSSDLDEIRDTLFELFLLSYATKIKTYCKIHNISGFVKWIACVYDVELVLIA